MTDKVVRGFLYVSFVCVILAVLLLLSSCGPQAFQTDDLITKMPATAIPTRTATDVPTAVPTRVPTNIPTRVPTKVPTRLPTKIVPVSICIPNHEPVSANVTRVIDGDTIEVSVVGGIERVRLIGIDTPEVGQPGASDATAYTESLVGGKTVLLWQDVSDRDRYNRLLAYVTVGDKFVNLLLLNHGYAVPYRYPPDVACADLFGVFKPLSPTARPTVPYVPPVLPPSNGNTCENRVFANCTEVRNAGCAPVYSYQSWYRSKFDRDKDGIGCE